MRGVAGWLAKVRLKAAGFLIQWKWKFCFRMCNIIIARFKPMNPRRQVIGLTGSGEW